MQVPVAGTLQALLEDIVADPAEEDEEAAPDEVGVAGRLAEEEGALRILPEEVGDLAEEGRGGGPGRVAALLARELVERHPDLGLARLVPVRLAGLVEDALRHQRDVDGQDRRHDFLQHGEEPVHERRVQVQTRLRERLLHRFRDLCRVHDVLAVRHDHRRDCVRIPTR